MRNFSPKKSESSRINVVLHKKPEKTLKKLEIEDITETASCKVRHAVLHEIEKEMQKLVGLDEVKRVIREIYAFITVNQYRAEKGLKSDKQVLHMMFMGNPGTGKTTMARLIGKLFLKMNVVSKGHLVEVERGDLVGEYIGHTALKTRALVKKAAGGILFIDEAYSLGRGGEKDFGREAIDTLVKQMEDNNRDFVLILAGYGYEMEQFLKLNPGLNSRFPLLIKFLDYTAKELMEIIKLQLNERQYYLSQSAVIKLEEHLNEIMTNKPKNFSNGRYVRNLIEKMIRKQASRIIYQENLERKELMEIKVCDLR